MAIPKQEYLFQTEFKVRDYECDLQGVVNNANYLHYMEHTRHEFLLTVGDDFRVMHEKGIDLFVRKMEVEYLKALRSGDTFISLLNCYKQGAKGIFVQDLYLLDGTPITRGKVEAVEVINGVLTRGANIEALITRAHQIYSAYPFPKNKKLD